MTYVAFDPCKVGCIITSACKGAHKEKAATFESKTSTLPTGEDGVTSINDDPVLKKNRPGEETLILGLLIRHTHVFDPHVENTIPENSVGRAG